MLFDTQVNSNNISGQPDYGNRFISQQEKRTHVVFSLSIGGAKTNSRSGVLSVLAKGHISVESTGNKQDNEFAC